MTQPIVSASWLFEHIDHPDLIILDATIKKVTAKENQNLAVEKIKNARFFDIKNAFSDTTTDIPNMLASPTVFEKACRTLGISNHHKIVVYDRLGIYSSPRVWWMFKTMGHQQIAVLDGGLPAWKEENLPTEPESNLNTYLQGDFIADYNPNLVINADEILHNITSNDILILDARSPGRFLGSEPEPRASLKSGHMPNAVNLHYEKVLQNGKIKPVSELKEILQHFTIADKKLIFTCGSGITACIIMLAATLAGYNHLSIYDGSWSEWGQLEGVPIQC
ncbi:sulfurtransferase [Aquimarina algicola]|uniref:Sulfurtransferase n=1 Tax=Aquimarina algicola TaxID=2589995 RepID=A0A504JN05_9FLAO|nr:sulfurtransferase [Aquimarina algicola]